MAEERAIDGNPYWGKRWGVLPSPGRHYLDWRHSRCAPFVKGKVILDVPSGNGLGLLHLQGAAAITCVDYEQSAVEAAAKRSTRVVSAICADMQSLPLDDASFECVVSLEGLEHLEKSGGATFLGEVYRVLRPGGTFLLSCPISVAGRHSGNDYHPHEWSWDHLKAYLGVGFDIKEYEICNLGYIDAVWVRAEKTSTTLTAEVWRDTFRSQTDASLHRSHRELGEWVGQAWTSGEAALYKGGAPHLMPTCFAVLASECCGTLGDVPAEQRQATAAAILGRQSAVTGFFDSGHMQRSDLMGHSATYIRMQSTYFAIQALDALGERPRHAIRFVDQLRDQSYLRGWLDGGPWHNPWLHSNNVMFALTFLQTHNAWHDDPVALEAFDEILDYLDERQDPASGLWQPDDSPDAENAVFAAYHFFPYYFWRQRPLRYVDRIIDTTLSIQKPGGLFGPGAAGGACEDLDAVHTLVMMSLISDHRRDEVRASLERCFFRLLQLQLPDGGYPNYYTAPPARPRGWKRKLVAAVGLEDRLAPPITRPAAPEWFYSGWKALNCPRDQSDMWAAWFRPLSLRLIADRYPNLVERPLSGAYRTLPGLGWHDAQRIRSNAGANIPSLTSA